jgi:glucose/arabinose dehydrogenase
MRGVNQRGAALRILCVAAASLLAVTCGSSSSSSSVQPASTIDGPTTAVAPVTVSSTIPVPVPVTTSTPRDRTPLRLVPHAIALLNGARFDLLAPADLEITPAAQGLGRTRFMARSPDGRIFVTDMVNLSDNSNGSVYVLEDFDALTRTFRTKHTFLSDLRNPNSVAFHTDSTGRHWLYLALTDRLVRYQYRSGDVQPSSAAQTLLTFLDYGLNYKYGGWHLTRTVAIHNEKIHVSVGSSCNACVERTDEVRAAIIEANLDGTGARTFASGLRNSVGMRWRGSELFVTNMGADHLGDNAPSEMF